VEGRVARGRRLARQTLPWFGRQTLPWFGRQTLPWFARRGRTANLRARGNASRGIALTLSPGVPAARCDPVPPRTGHDVIAPDAHTPTVPS
jgi:hypothetical protein